MGWALARVRAVAALVARRGCLAYTPAAAGSLRVRGMRVWHLPMIAKLHAWPGTTGVWRPLSRVRVRILRAAIAAMRPRGHGFDQPIDEDILREVEGSLRCLPPTLRICLVGGLYLMECGPPIYAHRLCRFSQMEQAEAHLYIAGWGHARGLRRAVFRGVRALVFVSFYQHPEVLAALDVRWADRVATLVQLRAELLGERSEGGPDAG